MPHIPLRGKDIRKRNEKLVLSLIQKNDGISQSQVANITGLKPPTVLRIFDNLESSNLITVCKQQKEISEKKGRRPVFYCVNPEIFYTVGIDFWSRSISIVIVNFNRRPVFKKIISLPNNVDADFVREKMTELIRSSLEQASIPYDKLLGIGVGAPGRVDIEQGTVIYYSRIHGMTNFNLKEFLENTFSTPVYIHNNCSVIALSEYRYGKAKESESLLTILIRSGVGGAFIQNGRLFVNKRKTTLELGHMSIDINGRDCECGNRGCLETYISEDAIIGDMSEIVPVESLSDIETILIQKDKASLQRMEEKGELLAHGIRNLYQLFNPDTILIVSRSKIISDLYVNVTKSVLQHDQSIPYVSPIEVLSDKYDPFLTCHGATDIVFDQYFSLQADGTLS
ncbi:MAG: ROK family transcriptional regulator [Spirochaetia bacterium]